MISLKSDADIQTFLDKTSYDLIIAQMKNDCTIYSKQFGAKDMEWIPRILLNKGFNHEGSKMKYGMFLSYQFRKLNIGFDIGIREIRLPENMDDFLDLYNEIQNDPTILNKQKGE